VVVQSKRVGSGSIFAAAAQARNLNFTSTWACNRTQNRKLGTGNIKMITEDYSGCTNNGERGTKKNDHAQTNPRESQRLEHRPCPGRLLQGSLEKCDLKKLGIS
jgi:hypothetical protein